MPARVHPVAVPPNEDFGDPSGAEFPLAVEFCLQNILTPDNRDVAEMLNFRARKLEPGELAAAGVKVSGAADDVSLRLPFWFAGAHDDGVSRYKLGDRLGLARKPGAPYGFAHAQEFCIVLFLGEKACATQRYCERNDNHAVQFQSHEVLPEIEMFWPCLVPCRASSTAALLAE